MFSTQSPLSLHLANFSAVPWAPYNDADNDGYTSDLYGGDDCDDSDSSTHPNGADIPGDGVDQNCDGSDASNDEGYVTVTTMNFGILAPFSANFNVDHFSHRTLQRQNLCKMSF